MIVEGRAAGLDLCVAWVVGQRSWHVLEPELAIVARADRGDARTTFHAALNQLKQTLGCSNRSAGDGNAGFVAVMANLEIGAGNSGTGGRPQRGAVAPASRNRRANVSRRGQCHVTGL